MISKYFMFHHRTFNCADREEWASLAHRSEDATLKAYKSIVDDDGQTVLSLKFIYGHQLREHWVPQILWLGPPKHQNTELLEKANQVMKNLADGADTKDYELSMLKIVWTYQNIYNENINRVRVYSGTMYRGGG